jgi:hypothetical protein
MSFEFVKAEPRRKKSLEKVMPVVGERGEQGAETKEATAVEESSAQAKRVPQVTVLSDTSNYLLKVGGKISRVTSLRTSGEFSPSSPTSDEGDSPKSVQEKASSLQGQTAGESALVKLQGLWRKKKVQDVVNAKTREVISVHFVQEPKGFLMLHPDGTVRLTHQAILFVVLIYLSIVMPLDLALTPGIPWQLELATDVFFVVDLLMNFRTGYFDPKEDTLVMDPWKVARNYGFSFGFVVDFITTVPLDLILSGLKNVRLLRIGRVAKISKLLRLTNLVREEMVDHYEDVMASSSTVRLSVKLMKLAVFTGFLAHWMGCAFYAVGGRGKDSWATHYFLEQGTFNLDQLTFDAKGRGPRFELDKDYCSKVRDDREDVYDKEGFDANCDLTTGELYLASVYFAVVVMATVGFGDITPQSDNQRAFCFMAMLVGGAIYGYLIGNIASIVSDTDAETKKKNERMEQIMGYMRRRRFPSDLERKVKK